MKLYASEDEAYQIRTGNENGEILSQFVYQRGMREEFEQFIGYKPTKEY